MTKKAVLFITLPVVIALFLTSIAFGQGPGKWDSWQKANCYSGISLSVANMGYSKNAGGYLWGIRLRNDYDIPVTFSYKLTIGEEYKGEYGFDVTTNLKPGEIWTDGGDLFTAKLFKSLSTKYFYRIKGVCFNNPYCDKKCFAKCDLIAGEANQQGDCAGNSSTNKGNQQDSGENNHTDKPKSSSFESSERQKKDGAKEKIGPKVDTRITAKPEKNKSIAITSGSWASIESKAIITVAEGGLMFERINNVENGTQFYKKKSVNEYEWIDPDGAYNCLLTVRSSKKVEHFCNGYSLGEYEFLPPISEEKSNFDIAMMNGEWNSNDGLYTVITKIRGNGFDAWNKDDVASKVYYKYISANEYGYTSPSGAKVVLKMMNNNRLESFQDGKHFGYFSRSASSTDKNKSATDESTLEADIKKLTNYVCKMLLLEEKLNKNENDMKVQEEYRKISEEVRNLTTKFEAKYTEEVLDSEAAKKIALEEWKKCPVKE